MGEDSVLYFAYGSNADPDRFRERVGAWRGRWPARLAGHRLRFAASVRSEGGGGAVIDETSGDWVDGVLYEITSEQLAAMDREEFDPSRDTSSAGRRTTVSVTTVEGPRAAEVYTVEDDGGWCAPSERYLGFILRGLRQAGHPDEVIERVRRAASRGDRA